MIAYVCVLGLGLVMETETWVLHSSGSEIEPGDTVTPSLGAPEVSVCQQG